MITLFDNWVILVDNMNYTLAEYFGDTIRKDGKPEKNLKTYGYFASLSATLKSFRVYLIRQKLSDGSRTLSEAIQTIKEEDDRIKKLLEGIEVDDGK